MNAPDDRPTSPELPATRTAVGLPDWAAEWLVGESNRLADLAGEEGYIGWHEATPQDREIFTLALRNLWDEVMRRG